LRRQPFFLVTFVRRQIGQGLVVDERIVVTVVFVGGFLLLRGRLPSGSFLTLALSRTARVLEVYSMLRILPITTEAVFAFRSWVVFVVNVGFVFFWGLE
jgi:hypothetical protein